MREKQAWLADAETLYCFLSDAPEPPRQADLILTLGSHDRRVPDYAAAVYHSGAAPLLVCTGGLGRMTRGLWTEPEAEIFARRCRELGVPAERLLTEPRSTNTGENFVFTRELLASQGIHPRIGLIVCKPYMHKRALATGQKQWPEVRWSIGTPRLSFAEYFPGGPPPQEVTIMVGDLQRLDVYAERGFQTPVKIPQEVRQAWARLVADGFDKQLI